MADEKAVIYETKEEAQYDETAKLLLAQKPFLANILVHTVKEFMGMALSDYLTFTNASSFKSNL